MQSRAPLALRVQVVPAKRGHVQAAEHERPPGRGRGRRRAGLHGNRLGLEGVDLLCLGRRRLVVVKLQEGRQADRRLRRRRGRRRRLAALRERGAVHRGGGVLLLPGLLVRGDGAEVADGGEVAMGVGRASGGLPNPCGCQSIEELELVLTILSLLRVRDLLEVHPGELSLRHDHPTLTLGLPELAPLSEVAPRGLGTTDIKEGGLEDGLTVRTAAEVHACEGAEVLQLSPKVADPCDRGGASHGRARGARGGHPHAHAVRDRHCVHVGNSKERGESTVRRPVVA
mmetsp:Transcript_154307/g.494867  ORF Transcript_154307/g.494867 Transcript_154307/m.494867 type:complete len:285 (+) Transcript_154307:573-1427(+)